MTLPLYLGGHDEEHRAGLRTTGGGPAEPPSTLSALDPRPGTLARAIEDRHHEAESLLVHDAFHRGYDRAVDGIHRSS